MSLNFYMLLVLTTCSVRVSRATGMGNRQWRGAAPLLPQHSRPAPSGPSMLLVGVCMLGHARRVPPLPRRRRTHRRAARRPAGPAPAQNYIYIYINYI